MSYEIAWNETLVAFGKAKKPPLRISQRLPFDISTSSGRRLEQGRFTNRPYNNNHATSMAMTVFDGSARRIHFWLPFLRTREGDSSSRG
ncbi:MAG: hypothetical protein J4F39_17970 [Candidatus Latescibacteria bacterium]|nr:hypothetical protein [Candidatus Latescibacterota bacterium]